MKDPALGIIEFKSVAKGIKATDDMVKKAPVTVIETHPVCPGKYLIMIGGEVAAVEESMKAGLETGGDMVINHIFLPHIHPSVIPALTGTARVEKFESLGVIETFSVAACVEAADIAAKATPVQLVEIRLANGLGGKAYFVMTGSLPDMESSLERAKDYIKKTGMLAGCELIASPHSEMIEKGVYW
ncbi:MAG: BMC domain-containing protein [Deltaproteobacteria bacterium]|nr:BMC domain-containing protein [Deltaproteobacteria bacterium]